MNEPKPEPIEHEQPLTIEDLFHNVIQLHGAPCYALVRINVDGSLNLMACSSNSPRPLDLMLNVRHQDTKPDYMG